MPRPRFDSRHLERLWSVALWLVIIAIAVVTRWRWSQLIAAHTPFVEWDTKVFRQIAELPPGPGLVVSSKPLIVPLVYRATHNDALQIIGFQAELSFWAWLILTVSTVHALRRRWVRLLAACAGAAFVLEPVRVGLTGSLMPESVNDSLLALCAAGAIALVRLTGRARIAAAGVTGLTVLAWLFTRDTNAFIAVTAAALALTVWRAWRSRAVALAGLVAACAAITLWSASVAHEPLPFQESWHPAFTPRSAVPMLDNVMLRVEPDAPDAVPPALLPFHEPLRLVMSGPEVRPLLDDLAQHGSAIYARWLVRHPVERVAAVVRDRWKLLLGNLVRIMPGNWVPRTRWSFRTLTANHQVLWLLLVASPVLLWRPRKDPLRGVAFCVVVSAIAGIFAGYYGDAVEMTRHCYGACQQLILGLCLAGLVRLDGLRTRAPRTQQRRDAIADHSAAGSSMISADAAVARDARSSAAPTG